MIGHENMDEVHECSFESNEHSMINADWQLPDKPSFHL